LDSVSHALRPTTVYHSSLAVEPPAGAFELVHLLLELDPGVRELKSLLVDGERAALEADFVVTHLAEFMRKAVTGKQVRVPYSVVYDLEGDRIKALRIYNLID